MTDLKLTIAGVFEINDTGFYIEHNKIKEGVVRAIDVRVNTFEGSENVTVFYTLKGGPTVGSERLFSSKEALLKSL